MTGPSFSRPHRAGAARPRRVGQLSQPQTLMPVLRKLGQRHADYGVRDEHYDTVGTALLTTLQQSIGVAFTPEVREAWVDVYGVLAGTMKEAARVPKMAA